MKITIQNYRRTQTKHREAEKGHGWTKMMVIIKGMHLIYLSAFLDISDTVWDNVARNDVTDLRFQKQNSR